MISKEENLASGPDKGLITQSFSVAEIYYSEKRTENTSDTDTSERGRVPHSLGLSRPYIIFQLVTNNRTVLPGPLPQQIKITGLLRKCLLRSRNMSLSKIHCCDIIINTEKTYPWARFVVLFCNLSVRFSYSVLSNSMQPHAQPPTLCNLPVHYKLPEFLQIHVHWVGDAIQLSQPLLSPSPSHCQSFLASGYFQKSQLFTSGGKIIVVSASASVLFNEYSGLISFKIDWLDLLAVQGTLKSLLQHHNSKTSILQHSAFFYSPTLTFIHEKLEKP